jgi:hypothetical protein
MHEALGKLACHRPPVGTLLDHIQGSIWVLSLGLGWGWGMGWGGIGTKPYGFMLVPKAGE